MKRLFCCVLLVLVFTVSQVYAQDLCVEVVPGANTYSLELDGVIIEGIAPVFHADPDGDWDCIFSIDVLSEGTHNFRVMAVSVEGVEGPWSDPFSVTRPGKSTKWKLRK